MWTQMLNNSFFLGAGGYRNMNSPLLECVYSVYRRERVRKRGEGVSGGGGDGGGGGGWMASGENKKMRNHCLA